MNPSREVLDLTTWRSKVIKALLTLAQAVTAVVALIYLVGGLVRPVETTATPEAKCAAQIAQMPGYPERWTHRTDLPGKPWVLKAITSFENLERVQVPTGMTYKTIGGVGVPGEIVPDYGQFFCGGIMVIGQPQPSQGDNNFFLVHRSDAKNGIIVSFGRTVHNVGQEVVEWELVGKSPGVGFLEQSGTLAAGQSVYLHTYIDERVEGGEYEASSYVRYRPIGEEQWVDPMAHITVLLRVVP